MQTCNEYLNDAGRPTSPQLTSASGAAAPKSKRTHSWHASYAVLAVMTSVLLVSGCDKGTTEQAATEADKAAQTLPENAPAPSAGYPADPAMADPATTNPEMMGDPAMTEPGSAQMPGATPMPGTSDQSPSSTGAPTQQP